MAESAQLASWEAWGDIVPFHVLNGKNLKRSKYAQQQDTNSDIPCCVKLRVPRDGGGNEWKIVYGMKEMAEMKIAILGGKSSSFFQCW